MLSNVTLRPKCTMHILESLQKVHSCMNISAHSCLEAFSNQLKVAIKQPKSCSDHEIIVLFESSFYFKMLKTDQRLRHEVTLQQVATRKERFIYAFVYTTS